MSPAPWWEAPLMRAWLVVSLCWTVGLTGWFVWGVIHGRWVSVLLAAVMLVLMIRAVVAEIRFQR